MTARLRITLLRSATRRAPNQRATAHSLGLRKLRASVVHNDTPAIRGMINTISHLVAVEEVNEHETA